VNAALNRLEWIDAASPRARSRFTGIVYLLYFVISILSALAAPSISGLGGISSDAATTAHYIQTNVPSVRLAIALSLISTGFYAALMVLFYQLFKPVSRTLALLAMVFGLVGCAITAVGSLFPAAPLVVLGSDAYLQVFDAKQLHALGLVFLNLGAQVGTIALFFFGLFQLALGYLIFRSTFLPRVIGGLIALAGVGWFLFLAPPVANALMTVLEVLGFVAEASLMLWLLVRGVDSARWYAWADGSRAPRPRKE
jgi:Domain of unknown function (DUF4386)